MVDVAATGHDGLFLATDGEHDVLIVDRMLPGLDGLGLVQALRATGVKAPVLFLTALGGIDDRVAGWRPAATTISSSRSPSPSCWRASTRWRAGRRSPTRRRCCGLATWRWTCSSARSRAAASAIELQPREFQLLEYLMRHADRVVTRTMLLEAVWDFHFDPKTNIVETHISRLRAKLDSMAAAELIHTVRGAGYMLRAPTPEPAVTAWSCRGCCASRASGLRRSTSPCSRFARWCSACIVFIEARSALQQQMTARIETEVAFLRRSSAAGGLAHLIEAIGRARARRQRARLPRAGSGWRASGRRTCRHCPG